MSFKQGHALVIGVGSYLNIPSANIPISVADADQVRAALCNPSLCGYLPEQVTFLHDDQATRAGILTALDVLAKTAAEETAFLYYCGHGDYGTEGSYYLTTHDTAVLNGRIKQGTGIREGEFLDKLRAIPAERLLLLLNSCHAGEISPNLALGDEPKAFGDAGLPQTTADALLSTGKGRILITAARPDQKSWIGNGKLSIFTQALVDGLSGKGYVLDNAGYISAYGLYEHIYQAVKEAAAALGYVQEPELTVLRGVGPFPVALFRGASDLGLFDALEEVPPGTAARQVEKERSQRSFNKIIKQVMASGNQGVAIGGNVGVNVGPGATVAGGNVAGRDVRVVENRRAGRDYYEAHDSGQIHINQGTPPEDILKLLDGLSKGLDELSLPAQDKARAAHYVEGAKMEAEVKSPDKEAVADQLKRAARVVTSATQLALEATAFGQALIPALAWAGKTIGWLGL